jgi:hypothetical protein
LLRRKPVFLEVPSAHPQCEQITVEELDSTWLPGEGQKSRNVPLPGAENSHFLEKAVRRPLKEVGRQHGRVREGVELREVVGGINFILNLSQRKRAPAPSVDASFKTTQGRLFIPFFISIVEGDIVPRVAPELHLHFGTTEHFLYLGCQRSDDYYRYLAPLAEKRTGIEKEMLDRSPSNLAGDVHDDEVEVFKLDVVVAETSVDLDGFQSIRLSICHCIPNGKCVAIHHMQIQLRIRGFEAEAQRAVTTSEIQSTLRSYVAKSAKKKFCAGVDVVTAEQLLRDRKVELSARMMERNVFLEERIFDLQTALTRW